MDKIYDFVSSVFIAKTLLDNHKELISSIQWDKQYLGDQKFNLLDKVKLHTSIKPLIPVIKKVLREHIGIPNVQLKVLVVNTSEDWKEKDRNAGIMLKESESEYAILLNEEESYCTQRFALCKELAEIYLGCITSERLNDKLDAHKQILEATRELIDKFYSASHNPKLTDKFSSSEEFAHSIALELMIPYTLRDEIQKEIDKGTDTLLIAERLFITHETLQGYLKNYFEIITPIYKIFD